MGVAGSSQPSGGTDAATGPAQGQCGSCAGEGQYPRLVTSFERAERNPAIVTARLRGLSERHVAETHGVSERHVRRVLQEYRESRPALHELDPSEALQDTLDTYEALIGEAVALADGAQHENVRLGALKLRYGLLDARLRMFPGIGLVPSGVERARLEADFTRIARQMLIILDRHGVPEHVQQEIVDLAEG